MMTTNETNVVVERVKHLLLVLWNVIVAEYMQRWHHQIRKGRN